VDVPAYAFRIHRFFTLADDTNVMQLPVIITRVIPADDLIHNVPLISLLFANIVTIVLAILGNWDLATVMFIYWAQSIIIGIFTVISLLGADTAALGADLQKPIDERGGAAKISPRFVWFYKCMLAGFFTLHYGLFHWGYFTFIVESGLFGTVNFSDPRLWFSCGLFFANHLCSHSPTGTGGQRMPGMSTSSSLPRTGGSSRCTSPSSSAVS
jgi:hypothetical protein